MASIEVEELLKLPEAERLKIVQALWGSIATGGGEFPVSDAERRELDLRLEAYRRDPDAGSSWAEVHERITST